MSEDLYIAQPEVELGVARRACPSCAEPLVIRIPEAVAEVESESAALGFGFEEFTPQERVIFDALYQHRPLAVTRATLEKESDASSRRSLDIALTRLRHKLTTRGWQLLATHGTVRLIEPSAN